MKEVTRQSMLKDINKAITILKDDGPNAPIALRELSEHVIGDVVLYKNVDAVTLAVLIYSIHKSITCISVEKLQELINGLQKLESGLEDKNFSRYNRAIKYLFDLIKTCDARIKTHVQDVLYAAKIKKGTDLLEQGLSLARASELMGISRWDILQYGGSSVTSAVHTESWPAEKRLNLARKFFMSENIDKKLLVDTGPIITLALSQLLWVLKPLKEKTGVTFYITKAVYSELVEKPKQIKRFQFEALHVQKLIREGVITIYENKVSKQKVAELTKFANNSFTIKEGPIEILQSGELETLSLAIESNSLILIDERTMRLLIERPARMKLLLESRKRKKVTVNNEMLQKFKSVAGRPGIIRSIELIAVAFELGLLDHYLPTDKSLNVAKKELLHAALWSTKYHGASVLDHEVDEIIEAVLKK